MNINLKEYDILGVNPQLYVEAERRRKTEIGGFTSIILVIILMAAISYFFFEVLSRNSFVVIYNQITDSQPMLNLTEYPIGVALFDGKANLIELEGEVNIHAELQEISSNSYGSKPIKTITKIILERCNKETHFGAYGYILEKKTILENFWCIPTGKHNLTLYGNWADSANSNSYLVFKISKCLNNENTISNQTINASSSDDFNNFGSNNTEGIYIKNNTNSNVNKKCKDNSIIDKNMLQVYLNIFFLDFDIDHNNYETPGRLILRSETFALSSTSYSSYYLRKKIVKYQTDSGFLFSFFKNEFFFQVDTLSMITDLSVNNSPTATFGNINISLSKKTDVFFRSYVKIQNALANIGGIVEGIFFTFSFLMKFLLRGSYYKELGRSVFSFGPDPSEKIKYFQPFKFKDLKRSVKSPDKLHFSSVNNNINPNSDIRGEVNFIHQKDARKQKKKITTNSPNHVNNSLGMVTINNTGNLFLNTKLKIKTNDKTEIERITNIHNEQNQNAQNKNKNKTRNTLNLNKMLVLNNNLNNVSNQNSNLDNTNNQLVNEDLERNFEGIKIKNLLNEKKEKAIGNIVNNKIISNLCALNNNNYNNNLSNLSEKHIDKNSNFITQNSKSNISVDEIVRGIFNYSICFCKNNEYYEKMKKTIRKDLSIENILRVVNSHEIIKNFLIEKQLINCNFKINYFRKIKSNYSSIFKNLNENMITRLENKKPINNDYL